MEKLSYHMRLSGNTQPPNTSGDGNMCFPQRASLPTRVLEPEGDIMFMRALYNGQSRGQYDLPKSTSM